MAAKEASSGMEVLVDRASKFYEPGEKVTGKINILNFDRFTDFKSFNIKANAFMDTVSQIRGSQGRAPLPEDQKTYFMKKGKVNFEELSSASSLGKDRHRTFNFLLESTEQNEKLLDAYVGVEFSIVVSFFTLITLFVVRSCGRMEGQVWQRKVRESPILLQRPWIWHCHEQG